MAVKGQTPGPWTWVIHDASMASIEGPNGMEQLVLSMSPCRSCTDSAVKDGKEWEFGRCMTPSWADAKLIAAAPDLLAALWDIAESPVGPVVRHIAMAAIAKAVDLDLKLRDATPATPVSDDYEQAKAYAEAAADAETDPNGG